MEQIKFNQEIKQEPKITMAVKIVKLHTITTKAGQNVDYFKIMAQTDRGKLWFNKPVSYNEYLNPKFEVGKCFLIKAWYTMAEINIDGKLVRNHDIKGIEVIKEIKEVKNEAKDVIT